MKKAFIAGITGQDGSYLAELLVEVGCEVHGLVRDLKSDFKNLSDISKKIHLHQTDITDSINLRNLINKINPEEIYNFAAQSSSTVSFNLPEYTAQTDALVSIQILETIRQKNKKIKYCQASSSELFGKSKSTIQDESTPFHPNSPYGCSKLFSISMAKVYRESYGIYACSAILFNHESPRRGSDFVTRKITKGLVDLKLDSNRPSIYLGNLDSRRDWGHAKDYVKAVWLMMQQEQPKDYIISMNKTHTVREFVEVAAKILGFNLIWEGTGINEIGRDLYTGRELIKIDPKYYRSNEIIYAEGNSNLLRTELNWNPKYSFEDLVFDMVSHDLELAKNERKVI